MRTCLCLLFTLLMLFAPAAHAADMATVATINQRDARFSDLAYQGTTYMAGGCGPASITNALLIALNVTDDDTAAAVAREMLQLLCYPKNPARTDMTIGRLARLDTRNRKALSRWPTLQQLMADGPAPVTFINDAITANDVARLIQASDPPQLIIAMFEPEDRWQQLCRITDLLYQSGYAEASISLSRLGAGNTASDGVFRSGKAGHYVTLHVPVQEFTEQGAVYLVDSSPRALEGEPYGEDEYYRDCYDFLPSSGRAAGMDNFRRAMTQERVSPTTIRLAPQGDTQAAFAKAFAQVDVADASTFQALDSARITALKTMHLMGTSVIFISLTSDSTTP